MTNEIEIKTTPPDLLRRLDGYHKKVEDEMYKTMDMALKHVQDSVLPYPSYSSPYKRTGTLGRTLGYGGGTPDIKTTKKLGSGQVEGRFGTRLHYAAWVIGDPPGKAQAKHMKHWWTMKDVKKKAEPGVKKIFAAMLDKVARWLQGQGT